MAARRSEADPVDPGESLVRRVWCDRFRTDKTPIVSPNAFEPRKTGRAPDSDGISLHRLDCLETPLDALATIDEEKRSKYALVKIPLSVITGLGLTVQPAPDERIPGHVVIPELSVSNYFGNEAKFVPIKLALALEASKDENIVIRPH